MRREIVSLMIMAAVVIAMAFIIETAFGFPRVFRYGMWGAAICVAATLPPLWFRRRFETRENGPAFPILTVGWRTGVVLIPIVWAAATKWPEVKSFSLTVLGCYFPFLVLESALSITHIRRDSGPTR